MTVMLCGIPSERPLAMVREALERLGAPYVTLNQRRAAETELVVEVSGDAVGGILRLGPITVPLPEIRGVFVRLMDDAALPEVRDLPAEAPARAAVRRLHDVLAQWLEITPATVANRAAPQSSNASKPYQAQRIAAAGLDVPSTLVTSDPDLALAFRDRHRRVVYKSASGARSIVRELVDADLERLDRIRWCPVQFQEYVEGDDIRVHCVGEAVFATSVRSAAMDYRYAAADGDDVRLEAVSLPDDVEHRCVAVTAALGLEVAGIDLRRTPDGRVFCFEVNPSPAFSYYESSTGQPVAEAIARHLCRSAGAPVSCEEVSRARRPP